MPVASEASLTPALPGLPHWESPPADLGAAIRAVKQALGPDITSSGRSLEEVFAVIEGRVSAVRFRHSGGQRTRPNGLASHRVRRYRGRSGAGSGAGQAAPKGVLSSTGPLSAPTGTRLGRGNFGLCGEQPVFRNLSRPRGRLLR